MSLGFWAGNWSVNSINFARHGSTASFYLPSTSNYWAGVLQACQDFVAYLNIVLGVNDAAGGVPPATFLDQLCQIISAANIGGVKVVVQTDYQQFGAASYSGHLSYLYQYTNLIANLCAHGNPTYPAIIPGTNLFAGSLKGPGTIYCNISAMNKVDLLHNSVYLMQGVAWANGEMTRLAPPPPPSGDVSIFGSAVFTSAGD
jgi:hypothetical protein